MLNTPLNNTGKTNLVGGLNTKPEMSSSRRHLLNTFNRVLNEYFGILTVIAVIIVLALSYNFILRPKYQKILEKINTNAFAAKQLEPKYQELTNYEKLAEAYSQLDPKILEKHAGLVPPEYIKEDLFAEVIYLFSHNGYEVKTLDVTREGEGTEVATSTNGRKASPAK
ncbi:MAG TPA: hypothetical protein PKI61_03670, partial [bacterium]|nr:hypothetical protein [bacterium]